MNDSEFSPIKDIRKDRLERYLFAESQISKGSSVIDAGCGCGYGAYLLSQKAQKVTALDKFEKAISYGIKNYSNHNIEYLQHDLQWCEELKAAPVDWVVLMHVVDQIKYPLNMLRRFRAISEKMIITCTNESFVPYKKNFSHSFRHYTRKELRYLLHDAGWKIDMWCGQRDAYSKVEPYIEGRSLVAVCT
jgi:ubiquinone/menaquinone biosynthesis C-methylase UbiE